MANHVVLAFATSRQFIIYAIVAIIRSLSWVFHLVNELLIIISSKSFDILSNCNATTTCNKMNYEIVAERTFVCGKNKKTETNKHKR
jgi:hypothetical protein